MKKWLKRAASSLIVSSLVITVIGCGAKQSNTPAAQPTSTATTADNNGIKERKFRLSIGLVEDHPEGQGGKKFKEIVEKNSGGKFQVTVFFNNQLGDDKQVSDSVSAGTLDFGVISTSPLISSVKEFGIFDLPFIFNNEKEADAVLDGTVGKTMLEKLPADKLIGLGYWENGFRNLTNSKKPVATLEDFKGLKIRTIPNQIHLDV
jgi:TRAP-type C4-dicarboxylate transport system substrate-binding protein